MITIIAVQLDYSRGTACAALTGYHVRVTRVTRVGQSKSASVTTCSARGSTGDHLHLF